LAQFAVLITHRDILGREPTISKLHAVLAKYQRRDLIFLLSKLNCLLGTWKRKRRESAVSCRRRLLDLRVFGSGLFEDGNIGVGVFPQREEIAVAGEGPAVGSGGGGSSVCPCLKRVRPRPPEMR
jgi:hypothetical protein